MPMCQVEHEGGVLAAEADVVLTTSAPGTVGASSGRFIILSVFIDSYYVLLVVVVVVVVVVVLLS